MSRPPFLSEDNCGFQGRSLMLSTQQATDIMRAIQSAKGYRDPTEDCDSIVLPVEYPCSVQNLSDDIAGLMPYLPWKEQRPWSHYKLIFEGHWERLLTWRTKVMMKKSKPTKLSSEYGEFSAIALLECIEQNYWERPVWHLMCLYSGERGGELWDSDEENQQAFRSIVDSWSAITSNEHFLSTGSAPVRSGWKITIENSDDTISEHGPSLYFVLPTYGDDR